MKRIIVITIIFIFSFFSWVFAETSVKAEVDKVKLTTDETLTYKLTITSSEKRVPKPTLPKFEGFHILSNAQSSTISFIRGGVKTILVYTYILAPRVLGKLKIKPSQIKLGRRTYLSEEFEIEVTQGKTKPRVPPEQKPPSPKRIQPELEEGQKITL